MVMVILWWWCRFKLQYIYRWFYHAVLFECKRCETVMLWDIVVSSWLLSPNEWFAAVVFCSRRKIHSNDTAYLNWYRKLNGYADSTIKGVRLVRWTNRCCEEWMVSISVGWHIIQILEILKIWKCVQIIFSVEVYRKKYVRKRGTFKNKKVHRRSQKICRTVTSRLICPWAEAHMQSFA